ncbi:hypothetical protein D9M71_329250 [compost metagenome]
MSMLSWTNTAYSLVIGSGKSLSGMVSPPNAGGTGRPVSRKVSPPLRTSLLSVRLRSKP